jgi:O-acetyl-ADP-ribose deacetylase (regulator of RNase III)
LSLLALGPASCKRKEATVLSSVNSSKYHVGDRWSYRTRAEEGSSTLIIGKVESSPMIGVTVHVSVAGLRIKNPSAPTGYSDSIAHMPFAEVALDKSVTAVIGTAAVPVGLGRPVHSPSPCPRGSTSWSRRSIVRTARLEARTHGNVKLTLVDFDGDVAEALVIAFARHPEVTVMHGDLLAVAENTVVSPANGYGFMDGGIDSAYSVALPGVERLVREAIARRAEGHLPVGAAILVPVAHERIQYMIAASTMLMPEAVDGDNAYRAMRAILRIAAANPERVHSIYCPGLCTGVGMVPAANAAAAMEAGYADWLTTLRA